MYGGSTMSYALYSVLCKKCPLVCVAIWNNDIERNCFAVVGYENVMAGQFGFSDKVLAWCYLYILLWVCQNLNEVLIFTISLIVRLDCVHFVTQSALSR